MLNFAQHQNRPSLRLLVLHDDADREFAHASGAEKALAEADKRGWTDQQAAECQRGKNLIPRPIHRAMP
jgi:hypothetical protein